MLDTTSWLGDRLQPEGTYTGLFYGDPHNVHIGEVLAFVLVYNFAAYRLTYKFVLAFSRLSQQSGPDSC